MDTRATLSLPVVFVVFAIFVRALPGISTSPRKKLCSATLTVNYICAVF